MILEKITHTARCLEKHMGLLCLEKHSPGSALARVFGKAPGKRGQYPTKPWKVGGACNSKERGLEKPFSLHS